MPSLNVDLVRGAHAPWDSLMTWVTFCSRDMGYTFALALA